MAAPESKKRNFEEQEAYVNFITAQEFFVDQGNYSAKRGMQEIRSGGGMFKYELDAMKDAMYGPLTDAYRKRKRSRKDVNAAHQTEAKALRETHYRERVALTERQQVQTRELDDRLYAALAPVKEQFEIDIERATDTSIANYMKLKKKWVKKAQKGNSEDDENDDEEEEEDADDDEDDCDCEGECFCGDLDSDDSD